MWRACALLAMLSLCAGANAQEVCPWLTQGTAAALMGGSVSANVHVSVGEGTCEFSRGAGGDHAGAAMGSSLHMKIVVTNLPPKECVTGERLTGVGEDAVLCRMDSEGEHRETIRGRVRATYFLLTLIAKETSTTDKGSLRRSLEQAAEEVAGNLF